MVGRDVGDGGEYGTSTPDVATSVASRESGDTHPSRPDLVSQPVSPYLAVYKVVQGHMPIGGGTELIYAGQKANTTNIFMYPLPLLQRRWLRRILKNT